MTDGERAIWAAGFVTAFREARPTNEVLENEKERKEWEKNRVLVAIEYAASLVIKVRDGTADFRRIKGGADPAYQMLAEMLT